MTQSAEKSRSQLKREEQERQEIALRFVELHPGRIDELPLEETTRVAIHTAQACRHHVQRRRACLHVATRLREVSLDELREIARRVEVGESIRSQERLRQVEAWVRVLLEDEPKAIADLLNRVPDLDVSHLRQLVRNLRRALTEESEGASAEGASGRDVGAPKRSAAKRATLLEYLTELGTGPEGPPEMKAEK